MELSLKGKNYFLAASTKGIGFGVARQMAKDGGNIFIGGRTAENLKKAVEELKTMGKGKIEGAILDASDRDSVKKWIETGLKTVGEPDGLLVNAGGPKAGFFMDFSEDDWESAFNLTLMSAVRMIKEVLPFMVKNKGGSVVAVTSSSVKEPIDVLLLSNVFRSGVTSLVKSLSMEFGKHNIRFNNLVPGRIDTDRVKALDKLNAEKKGISMEEQRKFEFSNIPMGRYGSIDEIGKAGAFLLSDSASYISGETLIVDGAKTKTVW